MEVHPLTFEMPPPLQQQSKQDFSKLRVQVHKPLHVLTNNNNNNNTPPPTSSASAYAFQMATSQNQLSQHHLKRAMEEEEGQEEAEDVGAQDDDGDVSWNGVDAEDHAPPTKKRKVGMSSTHVKKKNGGGTGIDVEISLVVESSENVTSCITCLPSFYDCISLVLLYLSSYN